jgi:hypothetical protein
MHKEAGNRLLCLIRGSFYEHQFDPIDQACH